MIPALRPLDYRKQNRSTELFAAVSQMMWPLWAAAELVYDGSIQVGDYEQPKRWWSLQLEIGWDTQLPTSVADHLQRKAGYSR